MGVIRSLPAGAAYDDFFDGQQPAEQWGIEGALAPIAKELVTYREAGTPVRIWGILDLGQKDYGGGRITVSRVEPLP